MKLNNKGFTLVEIIAVVAIMAVLMGVAVVGVSKYQESAREDAYHAMESSAHAAAQNYIQKYSLIIPTSGWKEIPISNLVEDEFLAPLKDPKAKGFECGGTIYAQKEPALNNKLSHITYKVNIVCEQYESERVVCSTANPGVDSAEECKNNIQAKCNELAQEQKLSTCPPGQKMNKLKEKIFE